ncbi:hypothetical protein [Nannocystis punicea]|uniref:Uncharacterized protein n=1 Tax=Nannocystis punicea TaxID=2995304 RepID=A0ABY7GWU9_9BACT|nr:hypothetical protein [Nannocystis poenicansa]WAS91432.1 hypothetical protein O0S08_35045 [Nannocystis poenicansa]
MESRTASFSEALRALVPSREAGDEAYLPAFRRIAGLVLGGAEWHVGGVAHRITEIELYWNGAQHPDTFAHGDPIQYGLGQWYFHRTGGEYRGGTYKGVDITFGREDASGGILIRGLERLADGALFDGPSLSVEHLLATTKQPSIRALVDSFANSVEPAERSPLFITLAPTPRDGGIYESPRIGLTLKRGELENRVRYLARPYRFLTEPRRIKKGRPHVVVGMHRQGRDAGDIAASTGSTRAQVEKYIAQYERGKLREPREFIKDLSAEETCQLFGACERFMGHVL